MLGDDVMPPSLGIEGHELGGRCRWVVNQVAAGR
jgi:hypothetical protein